MIWYRVGGADDPAGKSGLASLVEHATFRSTRTLAQHNPVEPIVPNSVAGEACTSYDYTAYSHVVPHAHLATVMQREANRLGALRVSDAALALEQQEMIKERRAEIDDVPEMRLALHLRALLSPTHPYGRPVLGRPDEVARLTTQDVATFHHTWYTPTNALLIVAGDITAVHLMLLVSQYYGRIPARPVPPRQCSLADGPPAQPQLVMQEPYGRAPVWQRSDLAPSSHAGEAQHVYALQVFGEILGGEAAGRLARHLVGQKRLATALDVAYSPDSLGMTEFLLSGSPALGQLREQQLCAHVSSTAALPDHAFDLTFAVLGTDLRRVDIAADHLQRGAFAGRGTLAATVALMDGTSQQTFAKANVTGITSGDLLFSGTTVQAVHRVAAHIVAFVARYC